MGFLRKASLCYTFPCFYGAVLFTAGEGNEQLARQAKANTGAVERPSGLAGTLLRGGGAGGELGVPAAFRHARGPERGPWVQQEG